MPNRIYKLWKAVSAIVLLTMAVAAVSLAATVTSANDFPSTLDTGTGADHEVIFTTPSGVAGGETITITFDSAFDTASITEDDVDVEDDGVDLTTAADCSGAEQASVAMAADVLTVTICAGDGGDIAVASEVSVKIGTNATASGAGSNQVTNPVLVGTYYLSIAGTFGDSGSIALPMLGTGSIAVTGDVSLGGGGGGGGDVDPPVGCGDTTAPTISSIVVSGVTTSEATVSWSTNENASSEVDYGTTTSYDDGPEAELSLVSSHSITLSGLTEGVEYHFRVSSSDLCANEATSSDQTFTTVDGTAPVIADVVVTLSCDTSATFTWTTDEEADSLVEYGTTSSYGSSSSDATLETEHSIVVSDLSRDTTYHYAVTSEDASANAEQTDDATFTTDEDDAPSNASGFSATAGDGENVLSWTNPSSDFSGVRVLACEGGYPTDASDAACGEIYDGTGTSVTDTGLTNGTTYYYGVFSYDACGQFASGALATGTPSATEEEVPTCGDGVCSSTEDSDSCSADCGTAPGTVACGDAVCAADETSDSCPADCPPEEESCEEAGTCPVTGSACGDAVCAADETSDSCPADCPPEEESCEEAGTCPVTGSACGDTVCASDEDATSCPLDCTSPEIPPTSVSGEALVPSGDVSFFVANRQIQLVPTSSGVVRMLSSRPLRVQLLTKDITKEVSRVQFVLADGAYLMAESADGSSYATDVSSPGSSGSYVTAVTIYYVDGTAQSITYSAEVVADGYVYATTDGQTQSVGGATVTLFENGTVTWDGSPYGQFNPYTTGGNGLYGWYVPNTTYVLSAAASGYSSASTGTFSVTDHIVNRAIPLGVVPTEPAAPPSSLTVTVSEAVTSAVADVTETIEAIRSDPGVQATAAASTPALAVATSVATVALAASFDLLPFLQYVFSAPFLFFWRRKRRAFGVVYNSISKAPIDLATVRIYRMPDEWQGEPGITGKLVQSRVTDKGGRHYFLMEPGRYRLTAFKGGFDFPSDILSGVKDDGDFLDVYHGEPINVNEKDVTIAVNIPLDPSQSAEYHTPAALTRRVRLRKVQGAVAVLGILFSVIFAAIRPNAFSIAMVGVQVAFYLLVRRIAAPRKPKSWGIVYDQTTGKPLAHAIARVFEPKYNKLLETTVTDSKGRYSFLLGPNEYYTAYQKPGYESLEIRPIDYRAHSEPSEFSADVRLKPEGNGTSSQGSSEMTPEPPAQL